MTIWAPCKCNNISTLPWERECLHTDANPFAKKNGDALDERRHIEIRSEYTSKGEVLWNLLPR
ncbi:hypothetical protein ccbrp13_60890 [Ktedonobacteria bacterium brp13]|nr:hypothetical protein ccbrp13_60890 [Ktedonobacteria bacterium brp13]